MFYERACLLTLFKHVARPNLYISAVFCSARAPQLQFPGSAGLAAVFYSRIDGDRSARSLHVPGFTFILSCV